MSSEAAAFSDSSVRSFSSAAFALAKCGSTKPRSSAHSSSSILRSARLKLFHSDCAVFAAAIAALGSAPIKSRRKRAINLRLSVSATLRCSFSFSLKPSLISRICLDSTARAFGSSWSKLRMRSDKSPRASSSAFGVATSALVNSVCARVIRISVSSRFKPRSSLRLSKYPCAGLIASKHSARKRLPMPNAFAASASKPSSLSNSAQRAFSSVIFACNASGCSPDAASACTSSHSSMRCLFALQRSQPSSLPSLALASPKLRLSAAANTAPNSDFFASSCFSCARAAAKSPASTASAKFFINTRAASACASIFVWRVAASARRESRAAASCARILAIAARSSLLGWIAAKRASTRRCRVSSVSKRTFSAAMASLIRRMASASSKSKPELNTMALGSGASAAVCSTN